MRRYLSRALTIISLTVSLALMTFPAFSGEKSSFNLGHSNGLAMAGYDVMSYWRGGKPMEGSADHSFEYDGATWVFTSKANLDAFAAEPEKYAPQFGGFCTYAASKGYTADVDPFAWQIWQDKLYLNYSPQVQRIWSNDLESNVAKGNANWPSLDPKTAN